MSKFRNFFRTLTALTALFILAASTSAVAGELRANSGNAVVYNLESVTEVSLYVSGKAANTLYESLYKSEEKPVIREGKQVGLQRANGQLDCQKSQNSKTKKVTGYKCNINFEAGKAFDAEYEKVW